ncbi:transporter [Malaciobacter halophilus]|uniref:Transporter n=1 Tax=Malaciobacter halophilus TaxID=197482 RepID=A0A2N1J6K3_9BACT|nr:TolC family protein [Malaciobacter halophilus]AXH09981.1 RND family efflux system, outer membrane channel protein, TolC family [Malaciobacter halophilus]PKI82198.1 transporter [Malaciobacter halophilus]
MHKIYLYFLIITFCFGQTVTFNEVLNYTLQNNKDLKNSKLNITLSDLNIKEADSLNFGKLSIINKTNRTNHAGYVFNSKLSSREATFKDFGFAQMNEPINTKPKDLNYPSSRTNINTKLTYDLALFTGFRIKTKKDILKLEKKVNKLKHSMNKTELTFEVFKAYNAVVVAKQFIQALKESKNSVQKVLNSSRSFYKEGLITSIDVKQAKAYELQIEASLAEAKKNFLFALEYLRFLSSNKNITDVNSFEYLNLDLTQKNNLYSKALTQKDKLKVMQLYKSITKKSIDIAKSTYYPQIYSHLEYGYNDNNIDFSNQNDYYNAVIAIKYTLFDNTRDTQYQKSRILYHKASINYEKQKDYLKLELSNAFEELSAKQIVLSQKKQFLKLAKAIFIQSEKMYKNHLISMTDLLKQKANFQKAKAELIEAKYNKEIAKAKIAKIVNLDFKGLK